MIILDLRSGGIWRNLVTTGIATFVSRAAFRAASCYQKQSGEQMRADVPYRDQINTSFIHQYANSFVGISERISFTLNVIANYAQHMCDVATAWKQRYEDLSIYEQRARMDYFLSNWGEQ